MKDIKINGFLVQAESDPEAIEKASLLYELSGIMNLEDLSSTVEFLIENPNTIHTVKDCIKNPQKLLGMIAKGGGLQSILKG